MTTKQVDGWILRVARHPGLPDALGTSSKPAGPAGRGRASTPAAQARSGTQAASRAAKIPADMSQFHLGPGPAGRSIEDEVLQE
ncbi:hypothetical protein NDU88_003249 [Pleurodeles waltl]|uniref:Uncharacterized protein n=1 Tax=Pleurodeles waltl TaxID=8319 RepID=A0AAV7UC03_PLEWA|nr:hypothetical protein NDU88_003249 [Pleurodeles waltl]